MSLWLGVVGRGGLEPPTSRLSGVRSNHLSYRPSVRRRRARRTNSILRSNVRVIQRVIVRPGLWLACPSRTSFGYAARATLVRFAAKLGGA